MQQQGRIRAEAFKIETCTDAPAASYWAVLSLAHYLTHVRTNNLERSVKIQLEVPGFVYSMSNKFQPLIF